MQDHPTGDGPTAEAMRAIFPASEPGPHEPRRMGASPVCIVCGKEHSRLGALDLIKRQLEERFPGWQVWFVPHLNRTVTWCARPWPLLNEDSPEHLAEAIGQSGKDNVTWLP